MTRPRASRRPAAVRRGTLLVALAATALPGCGESGELQVEGARSGPIPAFVGQAVADLPDGQVVSEESGAANARVVPDPFVGFRAPDIEGQYVNIRDRERLSYVPPGAEEAELEVWFFGGSALFGFGTQRDEHTIPSAFARQAEADGTPLRVRNFGFPAYVNYQETMLLARLLADGGRPDLVVFHDGYNDRLFHTGREVLGDPEAGDVSFTTFSELLVLVARGRGEPGRPPFLARATGEPIDREAVIERTVATYAKGVGLARQLGVAYGFDVIHTWQPDLHAKELVGDEPEALAAAGFTSSMAESYRALSRDIRRRLPEGVVDLSGALDDLDEPTFNDPVHVNEAGAAVLAAAIWDMSRHRLTP